MTFRLLFFSLLILSGSCRNLQKGEEGKNAIARAYDKYLYKRELAGIVPANTTPHDSAALVKSYIDNWIHQQVVLHKAESNLDEEKKDVEKQLAEYRNSLIRYAYEKALVDQRLDTVVADPEIEAFYNANPGNFELKSNILKVNYVKLNRKSPKMEKAKNWFRSDSPRDRESLQDYCRQYALNYFLDNDTWLFLDDLLKEIPIKTYDQEQFLQNNRNLEIEDSTHLYLVSIKGFRIKNSLSPLSFEKNNIRTMIINQRKLKLLEDMENQAYVDAKRNNDFEVYAK